ncbi:MAG: class I fructose-bisphosphate aldolase, partial [Bacilli bacterium]|nr:class I fructose-bisphosphate aldolase [Bacilli bacterium]
INTWKTGVERALKKYVPGAHDVEEDACERLSRNKDMIASFSRALLEGLKVSDSDEEFDKKLANSIDMIYKASI